MNKKLFFVIFIFSVSIFVFLFSNINFFTKRNYSYGPSSLPVVTAKVLSICDNHTIKVELLKVSSNLLAQNDISLNDIVYLKGEVQIVYPNLGPYKNDTVTCYISGTKEGKIKTLNVSGYLDILQHNQ